MASNIVGKTGWLILNAIANGETDPEALAEQAQGSLQLKKAELAEALRGYSSEHFRWLLRQLIDELSRLDAKLNEIDQRMREQKKPHEDLFGRLMHDSRSKEITAWTLIAELGTRHEQFPTQRMRPVGRGFVRAIARVRANANPATRAKATDICGAC